MKSLLKKVLENYDVKKNFILTLNGNEKILELGCGLGINAIHIKKILPMIEYYGVDILHEKDVPNLINYKLVDLENELLPFQTEYFDTIIFTHVIEHLKSTSIIENEIYRVLKKGGKIYIETPNWTSLFVPSFGFHRAQHYPFNFYDDPTHIKPWSKQGLFEFLFQGCSISIIKVGTVRNWLRIPLDFVRITIGLISGNRAKITSSFQNLYGWCIYGIGVKKE